MGIKAQLATFLNHMPAVDGPSERKALLTFTGPSELGIYLDWQGSNVEFTERLLEQLSRRGKAAVAGFLAGLPNTPQVANSVERQQQLAAFRAQVEALDAASFQAEFPVPLPAGAAPPAPPADPAMLASAAVNEVLAPYYKLGAEALRQQAGGRAVTLAERMAGKVEAALAGDPGGGALWGIFRQNPDLGQVGLLEVLKAKLAADPGLAAELAKVFSSAAEEPERGGLQALVDVSQRIGVVKGDVVGAVVGSDVLKGIGAKIAVKQDIETVESGGTAVGAVVGGSGPLNVGGTHHHGPEVNTGGGAFVGGSLQVGRDFVGRDQVGGDQITVGDISGSQGVAIGRDAQASVQYGLSGAELDSLFAPLVAAVAGAPPDQRDRAQQAATELKAEVAKGKGADDSRMAKLIDGLVALVPGAVGAVTSMFATPILGGLAGNATKFVLDRIQDR